jgi:hypothetical protein
MLSFDAARFLTHHFRDSSDIQDAVRECDVEPPSLEQIRKWRERNSIPADWLTILAFILEARTGRPVSLSYFMVVPCPTSPQPSSKSAVTGERATIFD